MNKKRIAQYCCAALVAVGVGLNIQNALENYGIGENSLSLVAIGGSDSNSNSNSNWNSDTDTWPDMSDSDSNGNGVTERTWKLSPKDCPVHFKDFTPNSTISFTVFGHSGSCSIGPDGTGDWTLTDYAKYCELKGDRKHCTLWNETPCPEESDYIIN